MAVQGKRKQRRAAFRSFVRPGAPPGTLVVDASAPPPVIRVMAYGPDTLVEKQIADPREIKDLLGRHRVTWINVEGLGDAGTLGLLGEIFGLHPLALEDVVNVQQRAKLERYGDLQFVVVRMAILETRVQTEQVSLFLGKDFVLTFQERPGDCFEPVRERIRSGRVRIRGGGADYLTYALLDTLIDGFFPLLEAYGERIEEMEDRVVQRPDQRTLGRIHTIKRDLLTIRRTIWPQRELINSLLRDPIPLITDETRVYLRDCYDHAVQIIDMVESYREMASGLMEVYLSSLSNRMNEVMKVLTIIATIFIPLGFIAGVYGMNFNTDRSPWNMPEVNWYWGYPAALGLMVVVAGAMLTYFRRKGWLGGTAPGSEEEDRDAPDEGGQSD